MHVRVGRLVAAGERLKNFVESSSEARRAECSAMVMSWDAAMGVLLNDAADVLEETAPRQVARDFDYLAFDNETGEVIGYGSRAIFALQYADEAAPQSAIAILYAGILGRWMWDDKFTLDLAWPLIGERERPARARDPKQMT